MAGSVSKVVYAGETLIDLTADTVTAAKMLTGTTAHDKSGEQITGTCNYDAYTSDATAAAAEILAGKTAYVSGAKSPAQCRTVAHRQAQSRRKRKLLQSRTATTTAAAPYRLI